MLFTTKKCSCEVKQTHPHLYSSRYRVSLRLLMTCNRRTHSVSDLRCLYSLLLPLFRFRLRYIPCGYHTRRKRICIVTYQDYYKFLLRPQKCFYDSSIRYHYNTFRILHFRHNNSKYNFLYFQSASVPLLGYFLANNTFCRLCVYVDTCSRT